MEPEEARGLIKGQSIVRNYMAGEAENVAQAGIHVGDNHFHTPTSPQAGEPRLCICGAYAQAVCPRCDQAVCGAHFIRDLSGVKNPLGLLKGSGVGDLRARMAYSFAFGQGGPGCIPCRHKEAYKLVGQVIKELGVWATSPAPLAASKIFEYSHYDDAIPMEAVQPLIAQIYTLFRSNVDLVYVTVTGKRDSPTWRQRRKPPPDWDVVVEVVDRTPALDTALGMYTATKDGSLYRKSAKWSNVGNILGPISIPCGADPEFSWVDDSLKPRSWGDAFDYKECVLTSGVFLELFDVDAFRANMTYNLGTVLGAFRAAYKTEVPDVRDIV